MHVNGLATVWALAAPLASVFAASSSAKNPAGPASATTASLGQTSSSLSASSDTAIVSSAQSSRQPFANTTSSLFATSGNVPTRSVDPKAWEACQSSWVAWSNSSSLYMSTATVKWVTSAAIDPGGPWSGYATYGTGDVYTTIDGIPHAHGKFTPTSTVAVSGVNPATTAYESWSILPYFKKPRPTCSIGFKQCSIAWQSYLSSLGLPTIIANATEPRITPMPTNRPRCSVGDMKVTCNNADAYMSIEDGCTINGDRVDIFYWPPTTANATTLHNATITAPVTAVYHNKTFTSPSVYLSLKSIYAAQSASQVFPCTPVNSPLGATPSITNVPAFGGQPVIANVDHAFIAVDPEDLSTLIKSPPAGTPIASVISELAHGGPHFDEYVGGIWGWWEQSAVAWRASDIVQPSAEAYYLVPGAFAPGLSDYSPHPAASTIWDDAYHPVLSVPSQLRSLNTVFASCDAGLYGLYDPPIALTPASAAVVPTNPVQPTKKSSSTSDHEGSPATALPLHTSTSTAYPQGTLQGGAAPTPNVVTPSGESGSQPEGGDDGNGGGQGSGASSPANDPQAPTTGSTTPVGGTSSNSNAPESNDPGSDAPSSSNGDPSGNDGAPDSSHPEPSSNGGVPGGSNSGPYNGDSDPSSSNSGPSSSDSDPSSSNSDPPNSNGIPDSGNSPNNGDPSGSSGSDSSAAAHAAAGQSAAVVTIKSRTFTIASPTDGSPTRQTINGEVLSAGSNGVVVGTSSTIHYSILPAPTGAVITAGSQTITATQLGVGTWAVGSTTVTSGEVMTMSNGEVITAQSNSLVAGTKIIQASALQQATTFAPAVALVTDGSYTYAVTAQPGARTAEYDGTTLSVGGAAFTLPDGSVVSLAPDGVHITGDAVSDIVAFSTQAASSSSSSTLAVFTVGSQTLTATEVRPGVFVVGTRTLSAGGAAQTIGTDIVSAASSGIVVDGRTVTASVVSATGAVGASFPGGTPTDAVPAATTSAHGAAAGRRVPHAAALALVVFGAGWSAW